MHSQLWIMWYLQVVFSAVIALLGVVAAYFSYGAAWSPIAVASTAGAALLIVWLYEPWAAKRSYDFHIYVAMCAYYLIVSALTLFSARKAESE